jgi:hypothetical protein
MRALLTMSLMLAALLVGLVPAGADPETAARRHISAPKWSDIVGIVQAQNKVGVGTGQITGGGQPWTTQSGKAQIDLETGRLKFSVRGLVLAGGNSIGTPGGVNMVKGTLVCDTDGSGGGGNSVLVDSPLVSLSPEGDADFSGDVILSPVCQTEPDIAFVIRTESGAWIANGSVRKRGESPVEFLR